MVNIIFNYNPFMCKYFSKTISNDDLLTPEFNVNLHQNQFRPHITSRNQCGYCFTMFESRNKLFHHLNFMNIDTRPLLKSSKRHVQRLRHIMKRKQQRNSKVLKNSIRLFSKLSL